MKRRLRENGMLLPSGGLLVIYVDMLTSKLAMVSGTGRDEMEIWEPPVYQWYLETGGFMPMEKAYYTNHGKTA